MHKSNSVAFAYFMQAQQALTRALLAANLTLAKRMYGNVTKRHYWWLNVGFYPAFIKNTFK